MARFARVLGISGAALLLAIPFVASAQEEPAPVDGDVVAESADDDGAERPDVAADDQDADQDEDRPEGAGPSWWDGPAHTGEGPPPWAGGRGEGGPPPWAGRDADAGSDRVGPRWYDGEEEWRPGDGKPPWAGGPKKAERTEG